jgi:hypothetical protein
MSVTAIARLDTSPPDYNVLDSFGRYWEKVMAGEVKTAKLLFLVCTSCLLDRPMHAIVKGPSSAGKSEVRKQVLRFFPKDRVIQFTAMSEHALLDEEGDFSHRILSIAEAEATRDRRFQDYLLRELMSEGKLVYRKALSLGGISTVKVITIEGPVCFLLTTTRDRLHPENETRMLTLRVDDSEMQTRNVLHKIAEGSDDPIAEIYPAFHIFHRTLLEQLNSPDGITGIDVPFAGALADMIPTKSLRVRRDFGQLLTAVKVHALLQHEHRDIDRHGRLFADLNDYGARRELMSDIFPNAALTKTMKETVKAVHAPQPDIGGVLVIDVARLLKIDKSSASHRLREAMTEGYVVNLERRAGHPAKYRVNEDALNPLPHPQKVAAAWRK